MAARIGHGLRSAAATLEGVGVLFVLLLVIGGLLNSAFVSPTNLGNVFTATIPIVLLAIGQTFVLLNREIDLSVGSTVTLTAVIAGTFMGGDPALIAPVVILALLTGAAIGLFNGVVTAGVGVPSFIVTLGSLLMIRGLVFVWTGGAPQSNIPRELGQWLAGNRVIGFSVGAVVVFLIAWVIGWYLVHRSHFGRYATLTGSSPAAARLMGIPVTWTVIGSFMLNGAFAAAAGLFMVGWVGSVRGDQGAGLELTAITAAVLGGVSLFGGRGRVSGAVLGALSLGLIFNLLIILHLPLQAQQVGKGVILIAAVLAYERVHLRPRLGRLRDLRVSGKGVAPS